MITRQLPVCQQKEPAMFSISDRAMQRRHIAVQGIVQGVGFRPFVYTQAVNRHLVGFVYNDSQGVIIEIEGVSSALDDFERALREEPPPLAHITNITATSVPVQHEEQFIIVQSRQGKEQLALISPDMTVCADCQHELFAPENRRYHYPFINCTNCGPRFTIIQDVPYDREKTTMRAFKMCPACQHEYEDPLDRRFHAQPNACPICGPQIRLLLNHKRLHVNGTPVEDAASLLATGKILAIKGLGGYHLACDALSATAVQHLRLRKHREARPFALMVPDVETAAQLCKITAEEAVLLQSAQRPILLLRRRSKHIVTSAVAPESNTLGIMLPYTPLHYLLLAACKQVWKADKPVILVMTSGNVSDEPIAYQDDDAQQRLLPLADALLTHNRPIHMRCDDSVLRVTSDGPQFIRRSRGYVPEPIQLAMGFPVPLLACGTHLKNTFCLGKEHFAFLSHHIGDLENLETLTSFREGIEHFQRLFAITPNAVAYDLHPDYLATRYALDSAIEQKFGVQHHHAHIASVLAEHGLSEPVIGIAADGTGYGSDGAIWGGEIMIADLCDFERVAHLDYVPLPGGDQAVRAPWRMAAVYLQQTFGDSFLELDIPFVQQLDRATWHILAQMIARNLNSPRTSSMGRLFDAVAALLGLSTQVHYEGQAAITLEQHAARYKEMVKTYPFTLSGVQDTISVTPIIAGIVSDIQNGIPVPYIAKRFHITIAHMLAMTCFLLREQRGLNTVALSGGVFQNQLLLEHTRLQLQHLNFSVYTNRRVPPNDGGVSLGQAAVASARLQKG